MARLPLSVWSYAVLVALLYQPPRIAGDQRQDRLHRVDPDRAGKETRVSDEQARHAVERPETVGHAALRVLAHPGRAHEVDGEQLDRPLRNRVGQQLADLA